MTDKIRATKKAHPKPASDKKTTRGAAAGRGQGRGRGRARRGGGQPRPQKKTIEELDAEMEDWNKTDNATSGAADGDVNMDADGTEVML
jgi:hypothetical protein